MERPALATFIQLAIVASGLLGGAVAGADGMVAGATVEAPSVEVLVEQALAGNPSLAALQAKLVAARERVRPAGALPDPMVEFMLQDIDFPSWTVGQEDMSMVGLEVRQDFPAPGKRTARRITASAEAGARETELLALRHRVMADVRNLYARLYRNDQQRQTLTAAKELLDLLSATVTARYSSGAGDQEAVLKTQLEISRNSEQLYDLAADRQTTLAALNRLLDRPGDEPLGQVTQLPALPPATAEMEVGAASMESPAVQLKAAEVAVAERRVAEAKLELKPNYSAGAGLYSRGEKDQVVTLRLGVELPLWKKDKQLPNIRAAEADLDQAREELRAIRAEVRSEAATQLAEWRQAEAQIILYREGIIPQSSVALDAARYSYLAGTGNFSTVAEDLGMWLEARRQLAQREADRYTAWAELQALGTSAALGMETKAESTGGGGGMK